MIKTAILMSALLMLSACADGGGASSPGDAQMLTLLGTGFLNGYNSARQVPPVVSTHCTAVGAVVNCLSY